MGISSGFAHFPWVSGYGDLRFLTPNGAFITLGAVKRSQSAGFLLETLAGILINGGILWLLVERTALPFYVSSIVSIAVSIGPRFAAEETRMWRQPRDHRFALHFVQHNISRALVAILVQLAVLLFFK